MICVLNSVTKDRFNIYGGVRWFHALSLTLYKSVYVRTDEYKTWKERTKFIYFIQGTQSNISKAMNNTFYPAVILLLQHYIIFLSPFLFCYIFCTHTHVRTHCLIASLLLLWLCFVLHISFYFISWVSNSSLPSCVSKIFFLLWREVGRF